MTGKKILEYIKSIGIAILIALFIRAYIVQAFKIPSGSMIPTLLIGDHLLVNKFIYGVHPPFSDKKVLVFEKPKRGDIIVFKYPEDPSRDFIKRVIGIEGDTIEIKKQKKFLSMESNLKSPMQDMLIHIFIRENLTQEIILDL